MWLLLKYQGYPPAVMAALLLHGLLLYFIFGSNISRSEFVDVENTVIVTASTVQENPQRVRRQEQIQVQRVRDQRARDEVAARERENSQRREREERAAAEEQAENERRQRELADQRDQEENERIDRERKEQEQRERDEAQRRDELLAQEQAERDAESTRQIAAQQEAEQIAAENSQIQSYTNAIHIAVGQNWSRPPSARNGMTVLLRIQLASNHEVVAVTVMESSGDSAVDRSAEQAVRRVARFYDLDGMPQGLFERQFRSFNLLFKVEDMLR